MNSLLLLSVDQKAKKPANRHLYVLQPGQNVNLKNPKEKENRFLINLDKSAKPCRERSDN